MAGCHRGECNTISLINEHSNKMDPKTIPLYSLIRASLNLHQTSSSLQYMVPNTVTMNLCIWWWIQRHWDSIHHLRLQQETSLMKHSVECSPLNETSVSHSFLSRIMDYGETWGEIIIRARSKWTSAAKLYFLDMTKLLNTWAFSGSGFMHNIWTRSNWPKCQHGQGKGCKAKSLAEKPLAIDDCLKEHESIFSKGVVPERPHMFK